MTRYTANMARQQTNRFLREEDLLDADTVQMMGSIYAVINVKADLGESMYRTYAFPTAVLDTTDDYYKILPAVKTQLEHDGYQVTVEYDENRDATFYIIKW